MTEGCPYRKAMVCYESEECKKCGWNPEVEAERLEKLKSGEVKSYLHINLKLLGAAAKQNSRRVFKEMDG